MKRGSRMSEGGGARSQIAILGPVERLPPSGSAIAGAYITPINIYIGLYIRGGSRKMVVGGFKMLRLASRKQNNLVASAIIFHVNVFSGCNF